MFQELHQLVLTSPIAMLTAAEGDDKLRVTITQKAGKKGTPVNISIVATPAELDAELAGAIAEASDTSAESKPVADQVREQLPTSGSTEKRKNSTPKPAADAKPKAPSKADQKQACVDDYIALVRKPMVPLSREAFIQHAATKRDFERLFGNWTKFKAAAERALAKAPAATGDDKTLPLLPADSDDAPGETSDAAEEDLSAAAAEEHIETVLETPPEEPEVPRWSAELADGSVLFEGPATRELRIGLTLEHEGKAFLITTLNEETHQCIVRPKLRDVVLQDGTVIGQETRDLEPGDEVTIHEVNHTVLSAGDTIVVLPPAPPPKVRKLIDDEGENLGTHEGEAEIDQILDTSSGNVRVVRVTEKAVFVELVTAAAEA